MGRQRVSVKAAEARAELEKALAEPLALIEGHCEHADWRSKALLEKLSDPKVLFDIDLSHATLLESAKIRGDRTTAMIRFHSLTAQGVWEYVESRRLETAIHLLVESDIPAGYIAELVGFSSPDKLCNAMKRRYGVRPSEIRRPEELPCQQDPVPLGHTVGNPGSPANTHAAVSNIVQEIWADLQCLPYVDQRGIVQAVRFHTREFIDFLGNRYVIASRAKRRRGVEVAELAALSAETSAVVLGKAADDLRALAYAWVAIAKRLALDYDGAEEAVRKAEKTWATPRDARDRRVAAEILRTKGNLRLCQRRLQEAVDVLDSAITESRLAGASRVLAQSLLLRACVIDYARMPKPTLPDLQHALRILHDLDEPRLTLGTHMILAYSYNAAGQYQDALEEVAEAWGLWERLPEADRDPLLPPQLRWNEGLARHGLGELAAAEALYEESRAAFIALEEAEHAAVVALDLARLCREQGRASEVLRLASEALPVLEGLKIPEAKEALALLRDALEKSVVSTAVLESVRATLVRIQRVHRR